MMAYSICFSVLLPLILLMGISASVESAESCLSYRTKITVGSDGKDNSACLRGTNHCRTLAYVLRENHDLNCTKITVTQGKYEFDSSAGIYLFWVSNLTIVGENNPEMNCSLGSGILFTNSKDIRIEGLTWNNCSVSHVVNLTFPLIHNGTSAIYFDKATNITIANCSFTSQLGAGVTMYQVGGIVNVTGTNFTNITTPVSCMDDDHECVLLGGGLLIEISDADASNQISDSIYTISDCRFSRNTDQVIQTRDPSLQLLGHAFILFLSGGAHNTRNTFNIVGNYFEANIYTYRSYLTQIPHAVSMISVSYTTTNNTIVIADNTYTQNRGFTWTTTSHLENQLEGGVLAINMECQSEDCSGNTLTISNCTFAENAAASGAVIVKISMAEKPHSNHSIPNMEVLQFSDCHWISNVGNNSGAALTLFALEGKAILIGATFDSCSWEGNYIIYNPNYTLNIEQDLNVMPHYGAMLSEGIPVHFSGDTSFFNNSATALYLVLATVSLTGNVTFANGASIYGGAIYLDKLAWIIPEDDLNLTFVGNTARYGGAIYTTFQCYNASSVFYCTTFGLRNGTRWCPHNSNIVQNVTISFIDNDASITGDAIYLDSRTCSLDCLHGSNFLYTLNSTQAVAAPAIHMRFTPSNNFDLRLGQNIFLNITTYNEYHDEGHNVTVLAVAVVTVYLNCGPRSVVTPYTLIGPSAVFLENKPFFSNMMIKGPEINESNQPSDCHLQFVTTGSQPVLTQFMLVEFHSCKLGFVYNNAEQMCKCFNSKYIICNDEDLSVCINYGYWYGNISEDTFTVIPCPGKYCQYNYGVCPDGSCKTLPGYCNLPDEQDGLCSGKRGGVLCTSCVPNHSFTFGAVQCVNSNTCTVWYTAVSVLLVIAFWIVMISIIVLVLKLKLRVGSGFLYAFIYYFSVVQYVIPTYLPSEFLDIVVTIFVSVTKLNPIFIGRLPLCFIEQMNSIGHQFFQYFHPLLISLGIFAIVILARWCPRLPNPAVNSGVHAICILILLSYSSLVEISFNLLNPVTFRGSSKVYVEIQADTEFFDPSDHLPFAIIAILVLVVIVLPFMVALFFTPYLMKRGVNLTKIKPILDEYQACYKDQWRWVAGYYFLCRLIVFSISTITLGIYGNIYILQILFMLMFGIHTAIQPYTADWLNTVDAVLLLDLTLISLLYGSTADILFSDDSEIVRHIILHILILIPCLYFIGFIVYILLPRLKIKKWIKKWKAGNIQENETITKSDASSGLEMSAPGIVYFNRDREPLLALLSDNGAQSAARYQAISRGEREDSDDAGEKLPTRRSDSAIASRTNSRSVHSWQDNFEQDSEGDDL